MQLNRRVIDAMMLVAGVVMLYLGVKSAGQYHREWSLRRSHAIASAVAIEVTQRKVPGGCSTYVRFEFNPLGSPETYETTEEFLATDDPDCLDVSWSIGETMQVAYVPEKPKIHRSYWGTLDRGIEPKEWMTTAIPGAFFALAFAYFVWLRRKPSNNAQAQAK